jgi:hypothetical protein
MSLDPGSTGVHLQALDAMWEPMLNKLQLAERNKITKTKDMRVAYATAYIGWKGAASAEAMRKQVATLATADLLAEVDEYEAEVRFLRDQLNALRVRVDTARSLHAGVRSAVT